MSEDTTTDKTIPTPDGGEGGENPQEPKPEGGDGGAAGSGEGNEVDPVVQALNEAIGKDFTSREGALKSVKDTYSYVGKAGQPKEPAKPAEKGTGEVDPEKFVSREEFDEANFYANNPEYTGHKELINTLRKGSGKSLEEVVQDESFKSVYDKAVAHDENQKTKSVLQSNPRLGSAVDKQQKARDSIKAMNEATIKGDLVGAEQALDVAKFNAVGSVLDAYEK